MTPQLEEALRLLRLARRDAEVFEVLAAAAGGNTHCAAGFHAQQSVEKALKAMLCALDLDFPRTHDLEGLASRLAIVGQTLPVAEAGLRALTPYGVDFRYDVELVQLLTEADMRQVVQAILSFAAGMIAAQDEGKR